MFTSWKPTAAYPPLQLADRPTIIMVAAGWIDAVRRYRTPPRVNRCYRVIDRDRDRADRIHLTTLKARAVRLVKAGDLSAEVLPRAVSPIRRP